MSEKNSGGGLVLVGCLLTLLSPLIFVVVVALAVMVLG